MNRFFSWLLRRPTVQMGGELRQQEVPMPGDKPRWMSGGVPATSEALLEDLLAHMRQVLREAMAHGQQFSLEGATPFVPGSLRPGAGGKTAIVPDVSKDRTITVRIRARTGKM